MMEFLSVKIADMKLSQNRQAILETRALGSCLGVSVYDPEAKVGGTLHFLLPSSKMDPVKAEENPLMFADTGIPRLFKAAYELGAKKERMVVYLAGGANLIESEGIMQIGKRNVLAARRILWVNNMLISGEATGGGARRDMKLYMSTGAATVSTPGKEEETL